MVSDYQSNKLRYNSYKTDYYVERMGRSKRLRSLSPIIFSRSTGDVTISFPKSHLREEATEGGVERMASKFLRVSFHIMTRMNGRGSTIRGGMNI